MSDSAYLKCECSHCHGHIEFPAHAVDVTITCPHCAIETKLIGPAAPTAPPPPPTPVARPAVAVARTQAPPAPAPAVKPAAPIVAPLTPVAAAPTGAKWKKILSVTGSVLLGLAVLAFGGLKVWSKFRRAERAVEAVKGEPKPDKSKPAAGSPQSVPVAPPSAEVIAKGTPPARKAGEDLQVLNFEVQKARDGNLQYVVGVVTNHAAKQYFNVKLEFALARKDGKTGDFTTDVIRNLAPNAGMAFKASIIGTASVTGATLAKLEGEKE